MEIFRKSILTDTPYKIIYLDVDDIPNAIDVIRKERSDNRGNELWFPMMVRYVEESPYGTEHGLTGPEGLLFHLGKRRDLERRIVDEVFREKTMVVKSKNYRLNDIMALL